MKKLLIHFQSALLSVLLLISAAAPVVSAGFAAEPLDLTRRCSLRLTYQIPYEGEYFPLSGLGIEIFRAVSFNGTADIALTDKFAGYPVAVSIKNDPAAWNRAAETLSAYAAADGIQPDAHAYTDDDGAVVFEDLEIGFYLIRWDDNTLGDNEIGFAPFMLCVPAVNAENRWDYDIDAIPKPGGNLGDLYDGDIPLSDLYGYSVVKLWMDAGAQELRPDAVTVDIYRDGGLYTTVELNSENYWSHSWIDRDPHRWTAVERNVPDGYTVEIEEADTAFIITNCAEGELFASPKMGVQTEIPPIVYLSGGAGVVLLLLALWVRRREKMKANA